MLFNLVIWICLPAISVTQDACESSPCVNGGTCISEFSPSGYRCICPSGSVSLSCASDACSRPVCGKAGVCLPQQSSPEGYICFCPGTSIGIKCSDAVDPCRPTTCLNGGRCLSSGGQWRCICPSGYAGIRCDSKVSQHLTAMLDNPCWSFPCQHGLCSPLPPLPINSSALASRVPSFRCICDHGYAGAYCDQAALACSPNTCRHGSCMSNGADFICICHRGFDGKYCERFLNIDFSAFAQIASRSSCTSFCKNGLCRLSKQGGNYQCSCFQGFYGLYCDKAVERSRQSGKVSSTIIGAVTTSVVAMCLLIVFPSMYFYHKRTGRWLPVFRRGPLNNTQPQGTNAVFLGQQTTCLMPLLYQTPCAQADFGEAELQRELPSYAQVALPLPTYEEAVQMPQAPKDSDFARAAGHHDAPPPDAALPPPVALLPPARSLP